MIDGTRFPQPRAADPSASGPEGVTQAAGPKDIMVRTDPELDAMNARFTHMVPDDKKRFLDTMDPALKVRWDDYVKAKQDAFAAAHPPVAPLPPELEKSIRGELDRTYPDIVHRFNVYAVVDCDGRGDPYGDWETQDDSSVHDTQGRPLDADEVLYHVVTMDHPELYGCLAINFVNGRMVPSVYGDEGPRYGEGSHLTIQMLGLYSSPIDGGDTRGIHDMYLIPGLGAEFMKTGQSPTPENLTAFCQAKHIPGFERTGT